MNGFKGLLIIIFFYVLLGVITNIIEVFKEAQVFMGIYFLLFVLIVFSMILLNKIYSNKLLVFWILISIIPAMLYFLCFCMYGYLWDGGRIPSDWVWGLMWVFFIPIFIGVAQVISIISFLYLRSYKVKNQ